MVSKNDLIAFVFVLVFASSLFLMVHRERPHLISYKHALQVEKVIEGESTDVPFYIFNKLLYINLLGEYSKEKLSLLVMYLPVLLGIVCAVCFYIGVRTRLDAELAVIGTVLLCSSSAFLVNSLVGVFTPEMFGLAIFSVSLMFYLLSDKIKPVALGYVFAAVSGVFLGLNLMATDAGILLAAAMVSSGLAQLLYYIKEGEYFDYGVRFVVVLLFAAPFMMYADVADFSAFLDIENMLVTYVLVVPFATVFVIEGLRDLIHDTKKYELFFLAFGVASFAIALYDPIVAAPGIVFGASFGIKALREHRNEKWIVFLFTSLVTASALFLFVVNLQVALRALALCLVAGGMIGGVFLLYENDKYRKSVVFGGIVLLLVGSLVGGVLLAQRDYTDVSDMWNDAFGWMKKELPEDAVVGFIGPEGSLEYLAERDTCCRDIVARYLLSGQDTGVLKDSGVTHIFVDEVYFNSLNTLAIEGNVSRLPIETYFFFTYDQDAAGQWYAYFISPDSKFMRIPVEATGAPNGEDVVVDSVGRVPYGRIRRFGSETGMFGPDSRMILPIEGRVNLFNIYFESPDGLELVYPETEDKVRIYKVS